MKGEKAMKESKKVVSLEEREKMLADFLIRMEEGRKGLSLEVREKEMQDFLLEFEKQRRDYVRALGNYELIAVAYQNIYELKLRERAKKNYSLFRLLEFMETELIELMSELETEQESEVF
jgi:hypothetical protein